ncbi:MAG: hypothetical protein IKL27_09365 [Oscillospiraceae bacterium]|nr:hypothetical protein [Oscillospiraceae bacterium]
MMNALKHKTFIGISTDELIKNGYQPSVQIVPAWFGLRTNLECVPEVCEIEITGKSQFKLFINGESVLSGPCRSAREIAYYDTFDIAPWLKAGENRITVQVFSYPEIPSHTNGENGPHYCFGDSDGPAISVNGKLGDYELDDPANWHVWLDKGQHFNNYNIFMLGSNESVNGALALENPFFCPEWSESATLPATVVQPSSYDFFGARQGKIFQPRPIKLLYREAKNFDAWQTRTFAPNTKESFVLDAGELTTAYFRIGLQGGIGSKVQIMYAESYFKKDENGMSYKAIRDDATGFIEGICDEYIVGGDTVYEPFLFRTFRFVQISVETGTEPLTILPQAYIETAYPLGNSKKPHFYDPKKEKLYDVAFRTLQLCAHDTYEDCPYYEQLMYACDSRLEMLFTYAATDDLTLPRHAIRLFGSSMQKNGLTQSRFPSREEQTIPAFALYFILMLEDYVNQSGDTEFVRTYIPTAERIVETFLSKRTESGMLAPQGYWDYFDWTIDWSKRFFACTPSAALDGESALQNLFFVYAMQSLCRLLPLFNRKDLAAAYSAECEKLLQLVEERCWDNEKTLYREGAFTDEYSQHTQIYAVLTGLADDERAKAIMEKVLTDKSLVQCSFMQRYYLFRALEKAGMYDRTEELWQTWQDFIDLHCTTFPETPYSPRSDCHGWSALPLTEFANG